MSAQRRAIGVALACLLVAQAAAGERPFVTAPHRPEPPPEEPDDPYRPAPTLPTFPRPVVVRGEHRSHQVNVNALGHNIVGDAANEPSIAVDPTNPNNIVIGWRQFDTVLSNFRQAGYAFSRDGGSTWRFPGVLERGQFRSDPVLAVDAYGVFYFYSLSSLTSAEMFVSYDGGATWSPPRAAFGGDKIWMDVDATRGPGDGNLYALWNSQFSCCGGGTDFTRSIDGGATFEGPLATPAKPKWGTLDVGPDGEVWVVGTRITPFAFPQRHLLLRSSNAWNPLETVIFDRVVGIDLGGETAFAQTPNPAGLMGQVWVAVDRGDGPRRGFIYLLASVDPPGPEPLDVMFVRSVDGGVNWSPPRRVHEHADGFQWFGTMSLSPKGRIDVVWNDTRNFPGGATSETHYAYSSDGGASWSAGLPVTPPFASRVGHPNQAKIGDYYDMVSDERGAALAYAATFNAEQDIFFLRVGDCNANGLHDSLDVAHGGSADEQDNGIPEECEAAADR